MNLSVLTLALSVSGIAFCMKRWSKKPRYQSKSFRLAASFFPALIVIVMVRGMLFEPFHIPTGSMIPTLLIGENILVSRHSYNITVPWLARPLIKVASPKRGDVVVFKYPPQPNILYVKRIIGLPGDVIRYEGKRFYINGNPLSEPGIEFSDQGIGRFKETVEGHTYIAQITAEVVDTGGEWSIPEGQYFVAGDNRDDSRDSRVWGLVPAENMIGKAEYVLMKTNGWTSMPDFSSARVIQ